MQHGARSIRTSTMLARAPLTLYAEESFAAPRLICLNVKYCFYQRISMNTVSSPLLSATYQRPKKLYRYSQQTWLERSIQFGEFRLNPTNMGLFDSEQIFPFRSKPDTDASEIKYLTLSLTTAGDEKAFNLFAATDTCLMIHNPDEFGERLHKAVQRMLPSWAGIDAAVSYGMPSPLGSAFSKSKAFEQEKEWLFAWRPMQPFLPCNQIVIKIGNIEDIAELRIHDKNS